MTSRFPLLAALALCSVVRAQPPACPPVSHLSVESGTFSPGPGVTFRLRHFAATLIPLGKTAPNCYQKMTVVAHAEIFTSNESLTQVFAEKLGAKGSQIKGFKVVNGEGKVTLSGKINKVIPIDFTIEGPVTTDGTAVLLNADKIKADGIPLKLLLEIVGEHLNALLRLKNVPGVAVVGNQLSFSPEQIAHLKGHIESVETTASGLTLRYSSPPAQGGGGGR